MKKNCGKITVGMFFHCSGRTYLNLQVRSDKVDRNVRVELSHELSEKHTHMTRAFIQSVNVSRSCIENFANFNLQAPQGPTNCSPAWAAMAMAKKSCCPPDTALANNWSMFCTKFSSLPSLLLFFLHRWLDRKMHSPHCSLHRTIILLLSKTDLIYLSITKNCCPISTQESSTNSKLKH